MRTYSVRKDFTYPIVTYSNIKCKIFLPSNLNPSCCRLIWLLFVWPSEKIQNIWSLSFMHKLNTSKSSLLCNNNNLYYLKIFLLGFFFNPLIIFVVLLWTFSKFTMSFSGRAQNQQQCSHKGLTSGKYNEKVISSFLHSSFLFIWLCTLLALTKTLHC